MRHDPLTLIIASGVAQTRAALMVRGRALKFFFAPARGDESVQRLAEAGDVYAAKIGKKISGGVFVDLGEERDSFLSLKRNSDAPAEGARTMVRVRRGALEHKGAIVSLDWDKDLIEEEKNTLHHALSKDNTPRRLSVDIDPSIHVFRQALKWARQTTLSIETVLCSDAKSKIFCEKYSTLGPRPKFEIAPCAFDDEGVQQALEEALERVSPLIGGARLVIDETEGGAVIDVDAGGVSGQTANEAAAEVIGPTLGQRDIGGRIVIDFLTPGDARQREILLDRMKKSVSILPGVRIGRMAPDGFLDVTMPRLGQSLLQRATEPVGAGWVRPGRRFRTSWAVYEGLFKLEIALARDPKARPRLRFNSDLHAFYKVHPQWSARLTERFGARFVIERAEDLKEQTYDFTV